MMAAKDIMLLFALPTKPYSTYPMPHPFGVMVLSPEKRGLYPSTPAPAGEAHILHKDAKETKFWLKIT